ncbi:hypothetical protein SAMN02746041_00746 [Desulfacinum hydrothermale DSM 13146]|uniref:DUF3426 domain-containing protein n=1 Tax=Desulfacinum hydrothermale DSM 13146 TaxID=1121390 RepID=A0A1W1X736_9BACT|nr:hypothetical protein [Desulfacinum hydrothermale]SMC19670.1 hypothetical protein SAMN02746041_00746 [Desulfacinum hydrothermale DSM 13146]
MRMRKEQRGTPSVFWALLGCLALALGGCAGWMTKGPSAEVVQCPAGITWDVAESAAVTQFQCAVKPFKGKEMLQYLVELQNVSDQPLRYRVQIINPEGKSVGGLIPRKGKPPVVKPGEKAQFTYPVPGYTQIPDKLEVVVLALD